MRAVAINVASNTSTEPGLRGPIYPDGSFRYLPIAEPEPVERPVTFRDLGCEDLLPEGKLDLPAHFDPEFPELPPGEEYTYGDPHGVKARPILELEEGDLLLFYATLDLHGDPEEAHDGINLDWGAYLIGEFRLERDPVEGRELEGQPEEVQERLSGNAHLRRQEFDARVLVLGDPDESHLYDTAVPISSPERGSEPGGIVTELSGDSGRGPGGAAP